MAGLVLLLALSGMRYEDARWGFVLELPEGWVRAEPAPHDAYAVARFVPEKGGAEIVIVALPDLPGGGRLDYARYARDRKLRARPDGAHFRLDGDGFTGAARLHRDDDVDFAFQARVLGDDPAAAERMLDALMESFQRTVTTTPEWHLAPPRALEPVSTDFESGPQWAATDGSGASTTIDVFFATTRERVGRRVARLARWLVGFAALAGAVFVLGRRGWFEHPAVWCGVVAGAGSLLALAALDGFPLLTGLAITLLVLAPRTLHCLLRPRWHWMVRGARWGFLAAALVAATFAASAEYRTWDQQRRVSLAYGTRRADYGGAWGCETGVCTVSIPEDREPGEIPLPWIGLPDPSAHFLVEGAEVLSPDEFLRRVAARAKDSPRREAMLFVHGYNNTFDDALFRAAQIAHDLQFPGAPILFSWPSKGDFLRYSHDEAEVIPAGRALGRFLAGLQDADGIEHLYVIGHSMGCRVLGLALQWMRSEGRDGDLDVVVLAAPDIDEEAFRTVIAPEMKRRTRHPTVYVSRNDSALKASYGFHGYRRAGDAAPLPIVVDGVDTIDVSAISGDHSYIGTNHRVLSDLGLLLRRLARAQERLGPDSALRFHAGAGYFWIEPRR